jgi:hypothetical protein
MTAKEILEHDNAHGIIDTLLTRVKMLDETVPAMTAKEMLTHKDAEGIVANLISQRDDAIARIEKRDAEADDVRKAHEAALADKDAAKEKEVAALKESHAIELASRQEKSEAALAAVIARNDRLYAELQTKHDSLALQLETAKAHKAEAIQLLSRPVDEEAVRQKRRADLEARKKAIAEEEAKLA